MVCARVRSYAYLVQSSIILVAAVSISLRAQTPDIRFEHISTEQGLSQDIVRSIVQDRRGFMWFGTEDGLNRYDGYSITVYKHNPLDSNSVSNSSINVLYEDSRGTLWIGTGAGLDRYDSDRDAFLHLLHDPLDTTSMSNNTITAICEDAGGSLWIGTGNGLNRYDTGSRNLRQYHHNPRDFNSLNADDINAVCIDNSGTLWVGTSNGLNAYDEKTGHFKQYSFAEDHSSFGSISCLLGDSKGFLWIGYALNGVRRLDPRTGQALPFRNVPGTQNGLADLRILAVAEDDKGNIWLGLFAGLDKYDPATNSVTHYRSDPSNPHTLSSDRVYSIIKDRTGTLWIGTWHGGINRYAPNKQKFLLYQNVPNDARSLSNNNVLAVLEDRAGTMWVGTSGGGLNRYDPATGLFTHYYHKPDDPRSISSNVVSTLLEDRQGTLWVGCSGSGGLDSFDRKANAFRHYPFENVKTIYEDADGNLWIGLHSNGLARLNHARNTLVRYRSMPENPDSLHGIGVWSIYEDRRGDLWLGTWAGEAATLNRLDKKTQRFTHYKNDQNNSVGVSAYAVRAIHEDNDGFLWFGTWGTGLNKYDSRSGAITRYTERDGLPNNFIKGILADNHGNLWISTEMGLSRFTPRTGAFKNFTTDDGLQGNRFLSGSCYKGASGRMMFGGENGLNVFHPDSIKDNPHSPPVVITQFKVFDKPVPLQHSATKPAEVKLSYDQNFISFEFVALDFTAPRRNRYAYMMEGFDRDWIDAGTRRYAAYTHLDGGEYLFRVKASNNDGVWNEQGASIRVIITPPFWKTWWFNSVAIMVFLSAGLLVYYRQIAKIKREQLVQQNFSRQLIASQEHERKRIAVDLHDGLGQTLLIIKNKLLMGLQASGGQPSSIDLFRGASDAATHALQEVRDISQNLRPHHLDQLGLTVAIESIVEKVAESSGIEFTTSLENIDGLIEHDNEINVYRIVQESLNNIVKHSGATEAFVKTTAIGRLIIATIEDNGRGMPQAGGGSVAQGSGMSHMTERARILGGHVDILPREGKGTVVKLTVPIKQKPTL
ncbi:MAG: two-component regulator propeller domain-containing protein [Bacteroidota bacterium]